MTGFTDHIAGVAFLQAEPVTDGMPIDSGFNRRFAITHSWGVHHGLPPDSPRIMLTG